MVMGNIIRSNKLNIVLILGISAIIAPIHVKNNTIKKEIPFLVLVSLMLSILVLDLPFGNGTINMISRADGIVILIFFSIFIYYLITLAKNGVAEEIESKYTLKQAIIYAVIGLAAIIIGGNFVVSSASAIAEALGVSQRFIALTIVALGTSLPELVTSIIAAKKGKQDLAVGNIIGSNIFNICFVAGVPATIFGSIIPKDSITLDLIIMVIATIILFFFSVTDKKISKKEGVIFLMLFAIYYGYLIISKLNIAVI